ncbi:MAG TPA: hypothetical protein VGD27_18565 [Longimicrobiales bacterium]
MTLAVRSLRITLRACTALVLLSACADSPTEPAAGLQLQQLAAGYFHTCGLDLAGRAFCWGGNDFGTLGDGSHLQRAQPTAVGGNLIYTQLTAGAAHNCALSANGSARCWGHNDEGQLGDGTFTDRSVPTAVSGNLAFTSVSAGHAHSCALTADGAAYCWGDDTRGQLGNGSEGLTRSPTPVRVPFVGIWQQVVAGYYQSCGLTTAGDAYCWGGGESGQNGDSTFNDSPEPARVAGAHRFVRLALGDRFVCGLSNDGVWCWGANRYGELGRASDDGANVPVRVNGITGATDITLSMGTSTIGSAAAYACAVLSDDRLLCWGGATGVLRAANYQPTALGGTLRARVAAAGALHLCIIATTRTAYCGGGNSVGQLGDGTTSARNEFVAASQP